MKINWNKAPEGTTHKDIKYAPTGFWYRLDFENDTAAYCPHDENIWIRSGKASEYNDGSMDNMVARPVLIDEAAAEDRQKGIEELRSLLSKVACDDYHAAVAIYDAGYRK